MANIILTVGKTHSGKTTWAKKIVKQLNKTVLLDSDRISQFLHDNFPAESYKEPRNYKRKTFKPDLKRQLYLTIIKYFLKKDYNLILANGNLVKKGREQIIELAKKYQAKIIIVHFDLPEKMLLHRIAKAKKGKDILLYSKNFEQLLTVKQKQIAQEPAKSEADKFFTISKISEIKDVSNKIIKLLK